MSEASPLERRVRRHFYGGHMNTQERTTRITELKAELADLLREEAEAAATDFAGLSEKCKEMRNAGNRIEAVKLYRNRTGCGLREAMYAVDAL